MNLIILIVFWAGNFCCSQGQIDVVNHMRALDCIGTMVKFKVSIAFQFETFQNDLVYLFSVV